MIKCTYDELLELHKIQPNPKNPNKHTNEQIDRLSKLIDYQGQRHPIIISNRSGFVVAGHGRLEAIKKLGWEKAAVNYQDFESEAQEYAFIVSDNAISEWAELDLSSINTEMLDLGPDFDIDMLGMDGFKLDIFDSVDIDKEEYEDSINKSGFLEMLNKEIKRILKESGDDIDNLPVIEAHILTRVKNTKWNDIERTAS